MIGIIVHALYILLIYYLIQRFLVRDENKYKTASVTGAAILLMVFIRLTNDDADLSHGLSVFLGYVIAVIVSRKWSLHQIMNLGKKD